VAPTTTQTAGHAVIRAVWNGAVLAEAPATVRLEGNHYFPADALRGEYFSDSPTTSVCAWKGTARYYNVTVDGQVNADAAWYYPEPSAKAAEITDHVAFWKGVRVETDGE
jgi:uncharacterized protein (DUF427 family)